MEKKIIFFICPIGDDGTEIRKSSDAVFKLVELVVRNNEELRSHNVIRADKIAESGRITIQIYQHLVEADICVVDLTGLNPNVLYELGIRQALLKPYILIARKGTELPFDLQDARTFFYDTDDMNWSFELEEKLREPLLIATTGKGVDEFDKTLFGKKNNENGLMASASELNIRLIETLGSVIDAERKTSEDLSNEFRALSDQFTMNSTRIEELFASSYRGTGTYLFINGENEAFTALTAALARAKKTIRTTRYSPFDVGTRQKEFAQMIQNRILGDDDRYAPVTHFYRIMSANNMSKLKDIDNYLEKFVGERLTLYLTSHSNNFELVIIDESEVFIHFHDKENVINSTLHIIMEDVAKKFIEIYSSLHDPALHSNIKRYDFKYIERDSIGNIRDEINEYFKNNSKNMGNAVIEKNGLSK
jgi:hypothetical protein